eukprot:2464152-Prymnesium_polylepis.1
MAVWRRRGLSVRDASARHGRLAAHDRGLPARRRLCLPADGRPVRRQLQRPRLHADERNRRRVDVVVCLCGAARLGTRAAERHARDRRRHPRRAAALLAR